MEKEHREFILAAISMGEEGIRTGRGGPFGAVIVRDGAIIGRGSNMVLATNDPTAHAEIIAIRNACASLGSFQLEGCILYSSCEPCPMCLGAIYWARPERFYYACSRKDAAEIGFDDVLIYEELSNDPHTRSIPGRQLFREEGMRLFTLWQSMDHKTMY